MHLFRLCRAAFRALDGEGARLYGGRWNSPGRAAVYTSSTLSLAVLEYLVHVDPAQAPNDLIALTIDIPDGLAEEAIDPTRLPAGWQGSVECAECRKLGDDWLDRLSSVLLRVPSAPIPRETNTLLNPRHPDFARVRVEDSQPFSFDLRLLE